ncbi:MAG: hypothetical protein II596_07225, partial [Thermoguttaceae bacterium]|nr:hypothetical protein [Thermoguttaceae bacterium]
LSFARGGTRKQGQRQNAKRQRLKNKELQQPVRGFSLKQSHLTPLVVTSEKRLKAAEKRRSPPCRSNYTPIERDFKLRAQNLENFPNIGKKT